MTYGKTFVVNTQQVQDRGVQVVAWVFLTTDTGQQLFPELTSRLPNRFWIGVLPHLFLLAIGYLLSFVLPRSSDKDLENLTIWTKSEEPGK